MATLDQSFTTQNDAVGLRQGATDHVMLAQSFIPSVSANITEVHLGLANHSVLSGNVWVEIYSDSVSAPNASLAVSSNVAVTTIVGDYPTLSEVTFTFGTPYNATSGTTYWVVLKGDYTITGSVFIWWFGQDGGGYPNGFASFFNTSWTAEGTVLDRWFKEYYTSSGGVTLPYKSLMGVGI